MAMAGGDGSGAGLFAPAAPKPESLPPPAVEPPKPAIKRPAAPDQSEGAKQVRFKTSSETSREKIIEALLKIKNHIGNPDKFPEACKLALQLLAAANPNDDEIPKLFFDILEAAMNPPTKATAAGVRSDYQQLFSAVQDKIDWFSTPQQEQIQIWLLYAQLGNDFPTLITTP